jgi:hypothetical protein
MKQTFTVEFNEDFVRQLGSLRQVAGIVGDSAVTQDELDMALDLIELLHLLDPDCWGLN